MRHKDPPPTNDLRQWGRFILLPVVDCLDVIDKDDEVLTVAFVEDFEVVDVSARHCYLFIGIAFSF